MEDYRKIAFHPGYYIQEVIEDGEIELEDFAKQLNISVDVLREIVQGRQPISVNVARKLSKVLDTSVEYWLNLQNAYERIVNKYNIDV